MTLDGIGVSQGFATGKVVILADQTFNALDIPSYGKEKELNSFLSSLNSITEKLRVMQQKLEENEEWERAGIISAHLEILEDEISFVDPVKKLISDGKSAAFAVCRVMDGVVSLFSDVNDSYIAERKADILDLKDQLLRLILDIPKTDLSKIENPCIVVAHDLFPSDTVHMNRNTVLGFVTETGSKTSHVAVIANAMGIPAVVGCTDILKRVSSDCVVALDGGEGRVIIDPNEEERAKFGKLRNEYIAITKEDNSFIKRKTFTMDGRKLQIFANIAEPEECKKAVEDGAEGIGLFRSEFLYCNRDTLPTEEEQYQAYVKALNNANGKPVIIRTLDAGGDKPVPALELEKEDNPFLGYRAIRICLDKTDVFQTQLRALLRASENGDLRILLPMISGLNELRLAKEQLKLAKASLEKDGYKITKRTPLGIMIEIPSAAVISDLLAQECDFFSIGTNDLVQYTVATDRGNNKIAHLYSHYNPAVLRLIKHTVENAHKNNITCGMCGEAASDLDFTAFLVAVGLDEFSVASRFCSKIRRLVSNIDSTFANAELEKVLNAKTPEEAKQLIASLIK